MPLESKPVVVDTNILFSALLSSQSDFTEVLLNSEQKFFVCEQVFVELFRRKEKIVRYSHLSEDDVASTALSRTAQTDHALQRRFDRARKSVCSLRSMPRNR